MARALESGPFWSEPAEDLLARLNSTSHGISTADARARLARYGPNVIRDEDQPGVLRLLIRQFSSPLVLILVVGAAISLLLKDIGDAIIILVIVCGSALLGFWQEARASKAVMALRSRLALTSRVLRDGKEVVVPAASLAPGDVILLSAGNLIPADALVLEATDFLVTQAALTGESFPVEKRPGTVAADSPIAGRDNAIFMGSSVRSGTARALVVATGKETEFGEIAGRLRQREPETNFARGVRHFGAMLLRVMFLIVAFVLAVNQLLDRPFVDSMLFAVALAVGLSPELLPAIVTVTLSAGARHLSAGGVIVRRLEAIENFGSMDVLCTDKTGTITSGEVVFTDATDPQGRGSDEVRLLAFLNARFESGIANPLDAALIAMGKEKGLRATGYRKIDEIPYDFLRRRLTIVMEHPDKRLLVTKGAFVEMLEVCASVRSDGQDGPLDKPGREKLRQFFADKGNEGYRVLAVASRQVEPKDDYTKDDEKDLTFLGFLLFQDPPKESAGEAIRDLAALGIAVKIVTGDNRHVAAHVAKAVGLDPAAMLTGEQLKAMSDDALWHVAPRTQLFVEIEPQQKERIVRALQRTGHAVGYLGDGINDAPALHAADIGISVDQAVDVARESADIVLLKPDLGVLRQGVEDGRKTFANTMKYISITISANFGNMVSMALATPFLPFLPLLPKQILLNNFLSDLPALAICTDSVDRERLRSPHQWDVREVRRFMVAFGLISSLFDFLTFVALLWVFHAGERQFQSGWFIVSLITEVAVVMVLRTRRVAWRSRPSKLLLTNSLAVLAVAIALPFTPAVAPLFGLAPLPLSQLGALLAVVLAYVAATEALKHWFYGRRARLA
jgi:Mg2+-importing ATPase